MGSLPHKDYLWHAEQRQTLHVCGTKMGESVCVKWGEIKKKPPSGVASACRDDAWIFYFNSSKLKRRRTRGGKGFPNDPEWLKILHLTWLRPKCGGCAEKRCRKRMSVHLDRKTMYITQLQMHLEMWKCFVMVVCDLQGETATKKTKIWIFLQIFLSSNVKFRRIPFIWGLFLTKQKGSVGHSCAYKIIILAN